MSRALSHTHACTCEERYQVVNTGRIIKMRCNVRESDVPCNVVTLGSMGQKNLTIGSAVGVEEGGVEKMMEMGQARQGVVDETCGQWMILKTCKGATSSQT